MRRPVPPPRGGRVSGSSVRRDACQSADSRSIVAILETLADNVFSRAFSRTAGRSVYDGAHPVDVDECLVGADASHLRPG
jgi:hypothetical protein